MNAEQLQDFLCQLFERHGVEMDRYNDWILKDGSLPAIRAKWSQHEAENSGRLDVQIALDKDTYIEECFVGYGKEHKGTLDALHNFMINSFHVCLAAFWDEIDEEQVTVEDWEVSGKQWRAYIGNYGCRSASAQTPPVPEGLFERIEAAIKREDLTSSMHWVRLFYGNVDKKKSYSEVLLDNKSWEAGEQVLTEINWPQSDVYYSMRLFFILKPNK